MARPSDSSLTRVASWVIRERQTGAVILETFSELMVSSLNTVRYEAAPILQYLGGLNAKIRADAVRNP